MQSAVAAVDQTVRYLGNSAARDKMHRTLQYVGKYLNTADLAPEAQKRMILLTAIMSQTRKTARLFKWIEFYRAAYTLCDPDDTVRKLLVLKNICFGSWLVADNLQWLAAFNPSLNAARMGSRAMQCWLSALVVSLLANIYKLRWNFIRTQNENKMHTLAIYKPAINLDYGNLSVKISRSLERYR